jgi:hypothetical protein
VFTLTRDRVMQLDHVLWIGGAPACGKTTIGRWLAHGYDLQAYNADAHTWDHHDRSLANGDPAAARWEALTPDERWLGMDVADMAELSLQMNAERFAKMVEDVIALPSEPMVVMEGAPLLPWLVEEHLTAPSSAVWLVPTPEFQRARLLERNVPTWSATSDPPRALANRIERERLVSEAIERAAAERRYTVLLVDESRGLDAMKASVADAFAEPLAAGAHRTTPERLRAIRRSENETLLRQVRTYLDRVPAAGTPDTYAIPFSCECGRSGCEAQPVLTIAAYEQLLAAGEFVEAPDDDPADRGGLVA